MTRVAMSPAMQKVAKRFAERLPARFDEIQAAMSHIQAGDSGEADALLAILHDLAGTAAPLGYTALGDDARAAESAVVALREAPPESRAASMVRLETSVARLTDPAVHLGQT